MKRRRLLRILLASVASITLAFFIWPREREPEYNGIPLSKWLEHAGRMREADFTQAIRHMGTNALPGLLHAVQYETPRWRDWVYFRVWPKLPATIAKSRPVRWFLVEKGQRKADAAVVAFGILGSKALPALDELRRIASEHPMGSAQPAMLNINSAIPADFNEAHANLN